MEETNLLKEIVEKQIKREEYLHLILFSKNANNSGNGILFDTYGDNI